jgi:hypothetical protein
MTVVNVGPVLILSIAVLAFVGFVAFMTVATAVKTPGGLLRLAGAVIALGLILCVASGTVWPGGVMLAGLGILRVLDRRLEARSGR